MPLEANGPKAFPKIGFSLFRAIGDSPFFFCLYRHTAWEGSVPRNWLLGRIEAAFCLSLQTFRGPVPGVRRRRCPKGTRGGFRSSMRARSGAEGFVGQTISSTPRQHRRLTDERRKSRRAAGRRHQQSGLSSGLCGSSLSAGACGAAIGRRRSNPTRRRVRRGGTVNGPRLATH